MSSETTTTVTGAGRFLDLQSGETLRVTLRDGLVCGLERSSGVAKYPRQPSVVTFFERFDGAPVLHREVNVVETLQQTSAHGRMNVERV